MKKPNGKPKSVKLDSAVYARLQKFCEKEGRTLKTFVERSVMTAIETEEKRFHV